MSAPFSERLLHSHSDQETDADVGSVLEKIAGVKGRNLAATISRLIETGDIAPGTRLPTVRITSNFLGLSTGSVASAWSKLQADGLVTTHGRGGTVVIPQSESRGVATFQSQSMSRLDHGLIDLAQGITDPDFAQEMKEALLFGLSAPNLNSPQREYITERLLKAVSETWPFSPQDWTTLGGGAESTMLALEAAVPEHGLIAVEQPTSPRIVEMIGQLGLEAIVVECDEFGPKPESLARALERKPAAFIFQPRAQVPLGISISQERIEQLARTIDSASSPLWVIEDDNNGPISISGVNSIGAYLPDRVLHIRSFCKTYGLDMRTSVLGGPSALIMRIRALRSHGYGMTSRIFQDALAYLLTNPSADALVKDARAKYGRLRQAMASSLRQFGITCSGDDGLLLWVSVRDEVTAIANLAVLGIAVSPGSRCFFASPENHHIRIATNRLPDDPVYIHKLAATIGQALGDDTHEMHD